MDLNPIQPGQVQQHATIAQVVLVPTVPAGTDTDLQSLGTSQLDRRDDIKDVSGLNDDLRADPRVTAVEAGPQNRRVEAYCALAEGDALASGPWMARVPGRAREESRPV